MLSRTEVINNALRSIAANLISDPDEDTESARQAKGCYDNVVQSELEGYAWYFAKQQASLPQSASVPLFKYQYAYPLPSDFIRLIELKDRWCFNVLRYIDNNPIPPFEIQGRAIFTNLTAPLQITYLSGNAISDPTIWSPTFSDVVSAALAVALAFTLTKSDNTVATAQKTYAATIARAKKSNAIQMPPALIPDGSWITARLY